MVQGFHLLLIKPLWVINLPPLYIQWTFYMVGVQGFEPYVPILVSLVGFEPTPHGPKPWTLPGYAIESLFFHSLM